MTPEQRRDDSLQAANRAAGGSGADNVSSRALAVAGQPGNGVLGGVCLTAQDSIVQQVVARLDFDNFKNILRGLGQFGDRWAGNPVGPGNAPAVDWIDAQLKSYGYVTERIKYSFEGQPREEVYATKVGTKTPQEMYMIGGHMDGRGGGGAINDDGSGTALVMEIARVMASPDIQTDRTIRFALWNNEETGLNGARAYVEQRQLLQGIEAPAKSGKYPEPKWLAMINHDMLLWDHGNPPMVMQSLSADVNVEYQLNSKFASESAQLGLAFINANRLFATNYPAQLSNAMSNTDTGAFQDLVASLSLRDGRRLYEMGRGSSPTYHQPTDIFPTFTDQDYRLGFNAIQTTLGAVAKLTEVKITPKAMTP
ncbi:MAG: M20/M25/M40 family metallo-hydrolase [Gemmatimonadetes bacterium]|nr:M20/M25/M40 family metallo-hydrolase [Gemmatimonadota bacterium]